MSRANLVTFGAWVLMSTSAFSAVSSDSPADAANASSMSDPEACVIDTARASPEIHAAYAPQAWALRDEVFLRACHESNGAFIDATDPTLGKRLLRPDGITADNLEDHYPPEAKRAHLSGWIDIIFVVEKDGTVSNVTPAQGAEVFLQAAVAVGKSIKYRKPAYLDGKPIRSLGYVRFRFG